MNRNYRRGRAAEWRVVRAFKSIECAVTRSAGSKGLWDVCVLHPSGKVTLIQVKAVGPKAPWRDSNWHDLTSRKLAPNVQVQAFVFRRGRRAPEVYDA